jgi:fucose 4-O-acetylase-like acetyltransferase
VNEVRSADDAPERIDAIDFVKALAIVAVAFTHVGLGPWSPRYSAWDFWLCAVWVNFQVPAFLLVSGFLYHRGGAIPAGIVRARLVRVLVPYLVACGVAYALGVAEAGSWGALLFQLATASTLGIYYFVFLLLLFIPTIWVLSRLSRRWLWALCAALWGWGLLVEIYAYVFLVGAEGETAPFQGLFWLMRSPLNFTYAMFVTGWLVAAHGEALSRWVGARRPAVGAACVAGVLGYLVLGRMAPWLSAGVLRSLYTLAVVACVVLATRGWTAPGWVRFLSETSLGLYLYHQMFQVGLQPLVAGWTAPLRIAAVALGGLSAAAALCLAGRRLLGGRARLLLGA